MTMNYDVFLKEYLEFITKKFPKATSVKRNVLPATTSFYMQYCTKWKISFLGMTDLIAPVAISVDESAESQKAKLVWDDLLFWLTHCKLESTVGGPGIAKRVAASKKYLSSENSSKRDEAMDIVDLVESIVEISSTIDNEEKVSLIQGLHRLRKLL